MGLFEHLCGTIQIWRFLISFPVNIARQGYMMVYHIFRQTQLWYKIGQFNQVSHYNSTINTVHIRFIFYSYPIRTVIHIPLSIIRYRLYIPFNPLNIPWIYDIIIIHMYIYIYMYTLHAQLYRLICWDSPCWAYQSCPHPQVPEASSKEFPAPDGRSDFFGWPDWHGAFMMSLLLDLGKP